MTTDMNQEAIFTTESNEKSGLMIEKNLWVPDRSVHQCFNWYKEFNIFLRKHHWRICGHIFCHQCSITRKLKRTTGKPQKYRFCYSWIDMNTRFQEQIKINHNMVHSFAKGDSNYYEMREYLDNNNNPLLDSFSGSTRFNLNTTNK